MVNGFIVDVRQMPREVQEEALRKGLIPYLSIFKCKVLYRKLQTARAQPGA